MLTDSEKRAAALAVHRFGVDRERIKEAANAVLRAHAEGRPTDFVKTLVRRKLISQSQAKELRQALNSSAQSHASCQVTVRPAVTVDENGRSQDPAPGSRPEFRRLGQFRILRQLGEGGMGSVYLGYNEEQGRHVALKVLSDTLAQNQAYVERFYREARSVAQLDHPNIVRGLATGTDAATGKYFMVLEYVDGTNCRDLLERYGRLPVGDAVHIILEIARALEHAHSRNIVHRDIKPDNILLTKSGTAKLADLGLAKRTDDVSQLTATRQGFGTPSYMPYEQALDAKKADGRSDIYALGGTLYHLVTGQLPFPGNNPVEVVEKKDVGVFTPASELDPAIPTVLDKILAKMMARFPRDRYQTASELIVALERSKLSARVPTFADPEAALQDLELQARLAESPEPTRLDLGAQVSRPSPGAVRNKSARGRRHANAANRERPSRRKIWLAVLGLILLGAIATVSAIWLWR
jgi:serine/threonine-protein kinase